MLLALPEVENETGEEEKEEEEKGEEEKEEEEEASGSECRCVSRERTSDGDLSIGQRKADAILQCGQPFDSKSEIWHCGCDDESEKKATAAEARTTSATDDDTDGGQYASLRPTRTGCKPSAARGNALYLNYDEADLQNLILYAKQQMTGMD